MDAQVETGRRLLRERGWFPSLLRAVFGKPKGIGEGPKPPPGPGGAVPAPWRPRSPRDPQLSASALRQWAAAIGLEIIPERVLLWPRAGGSWGAGSAPCQGPRGILTQGLLWHPRVSPCRAAHSLSPSSKDGVAVPRCQPRVLSNVGVPGLSPRVVWSTPDQGQSTPGLGKGSWIRGFCKLRFSMGSAGLRARCGHTHTQKIHTQNKYTHTKKHTHKKTHTAGPICTPRAFPRVPAPPCSPQPLQGPSQPALAP